MERISYLRYGIFGNRRTAALVSPDGSIDWCCMPHLDSPSVFSAIIDNENGGYFRIKPSDSFSSYQHYIRATNVIETAFKTMSGAVIVTDFMPIIKDDDEDNPEIIRIVRCCDGEMKLEIDYYPKFNYGKGWNKLAKIAGGILTRNYDETAVLASDLAFAINEGHARVRTSIMSGEEFALVFMYGMFSPSKRLEGVLDKLAGTVRYWRGWVPHGGVTADAIKGIMHDGLIESRLFLKLVTNTETGMVVESPNMYKAASSKRSMFYDGRLCWIHGMSSALSAFACLGYEAETTSIMNRLIKVSLAAIDSGEFQNVFLYNGEKEVKDITIKTGSGEMASIRYGGQLAYGFGYYSIGLVMYAVYEVLRIKDKAPDASLWRHLTTFIETAKACFPKADGDFWRLTDEKKHFVFSKLMCWTAVDCGIKMARQYSLDADLEAWEKSCSLMRDEIATKGYNSTIKSFVNSYGSDIIDSTALLMLRFGFLPSHDEKFVATVKHIEHDLVCKDYIVKNTSASEISSGYSICSFWLADCYARMGREKEARDVLTAFLSLNDPLLLFPEMYDQETGNLKGFYPHAYAHSEYILSVMALLTPNK